jgi:hypothetical protein
MAEPVAGVWAMVLFRNLLRDRRRCGVRVAPTGVLNQDLGKKTRRNRFDLSAFLEGFRNLAGDTASSNTKLLRGLNANVTYFTTPEVVIFPSVGEEFGSFWSCSGDDSVHRR